MLHVAISKAEVADDAHQGGHPKALQTSKMLAPLLAFLDNPAEAEKDRATDLAKPTDPLATKVEIHSAEEEVLANIAATRVVAISNDAVATIIGACPLSMYVVVHAEFQPNLDLPLFGAVKTDAPLHSLTQLLGTEAEGDATCTEAPCANHPILEAEIILGRASHVYFVRGVLTMKWQLLNLVSVKTEETLVCQENTQDDALYTEIQRLPSFRGEGDDVEKKAEAWIEAMDGYFIAVKTTSANQSMLGMFQLTSDAKLWWKQHCHDIGVAENSQSWREIKQAVKEVHLPSAHKALKMNEFFALKQRGLSLEDYYLKFVSLRHYAPAMTIEQQVVQFCQGLNEPISS
ncbi:hypothetical protein L7F22_061600 [Adiantum nelumboides]|nr:hypothetical protein [Adiantum nelumboides]